MAVQTSLKQVAKQLSAVVQTFAASEGLDQDQIAIAGAFDQTTDQISLMVGSAQLIDEGYWYSEIRKRIRAEFGVASPVAYLVTLNVKNLQNLDEVYRNLILTEDEIDLTEML